MKKEKFCPRCSNKLEKEKEKEIDYPLVCWECDENFYEFEAENKYTCCGNEVTQEVKETGRCPTCSENI